MGGTNSDNYFYWRRWLFKTPGWRLEPKVAPSQLSVPINSEFLRIMNSKNRAGRSEIIYKIVNIEFSPLNKIAKNSLWYKTIYLLLGNKRIGQNGLQSYPKICSLAFGVCGSSLLKNGYIFFGLWLLVCQFINISNQMEVNGHISNLG